MNEQFDKKPDSVYSKRLKAGKRRTYFFDVRATRGNDYFITITESRKRTTDDGYDRHKIFLYKEDFHKFQKGLNEAVDFVKTDLMPDFDFDSFNHEQEFEGGEDISEKPYIAPELLKKTTETVTDGDGNAAHRDIIDGTSLKHDGVDGIPIDGKKFTTPNLSEEVDKW